MPRRFSRVLTLMALVSWLGDVIQPVRAAEETTTLQFPNNPIGDILVIYEKLTGKRLIKDANLTGPSLSIVAPQPIPQSEAIRLIEAVLILNGYSLVPSEDNSIKVLNTTSGKSPRSEAVPLYASASALPKGDQIVSFFMPLRYIAPNEALMVFQGHIKLHSFGSLVPVPNAQALVVTENASVVRNLISLQELIDIPPAKVASEFVALERADAERVTEILTKLLDTRKNTPTAATPAAPALATPATGTPAPSAPAAPAVGEAALYERNLVVGDVQLVPDPRTNRILVITRPVNLGYIKDLIREFDQATRLTDPVELPLRYVSASEVLPVLQSVLAETKDGTTSTGANRATPTPAAAATGALSKPDRLSATAEDTTPESVMVGKTRLIADKKANSILVMGLADSIEKVRTIVEQLDRRPRQVYLSTVIGQLRLGDGIEFGVDLLQKFARTGDTGVDASGVASALRTRSRAADIVPDPKSLLTGGAFPLPAGLTIYGSVGKALDVYIKALESSNRFKVISRPAVYTANNKKAVISSGQKVAVPTSTLTSLNTGTTNNASVSASIDYKDVVLKLEVLPIINANKEVTLQIAQQNDSIVGSQTISGNTVPTIGTQEINTTVTVPNRSTVVLGGLITDFTTKDTVGVPFLSRIPLIGELFKSTTKTMERSELIVLIQPTVIETEEELASASQSEQDRVVIGNDASHGAEAIPFDANTGKFPKRPKHPSTQPRRQLGSQPVEPSPSAGETPAE
ncbi:MAG: hypothetical protein HY360_05455 [Verrucomicrobia bacterium]|nr:hypothetical protein [Verrucomicrobiota bacterium]